MKKKLLGMLAVTALIFTGCGANDSKTESTKESSKGNSESTVITTYNYEKKPVEQTFKKVPEKVVAVYQSPIEIMLALGLEDKMVAASQLDTDVKPEFKDAFKKVKYYDKAPSKEEVLSLNPDFIFSWYSYFGPDTLGDVDFWMDRDTNTYMAQNSGVKTPNTLENEYEDILNIGKIFNVEDKAQKMVDDMKSEIEKSIKFAEGKEKVTAIIFEVNKDGQYRIYGADSIGGDMAQQVGAELVADKNGNITKEELVKLNPDVIFSVYYGESIEEKQALTSITENDALKNLDAVKNERVYPMVLSNVYSTGIRTLDGIQAISEGLYPDLHK